MKKSSILAGLVVISMNTWGMSYDNASGTSVPIHWQKIKQAPLSDNLQNWRKSNDDALNFADVVPVDEEQLWSPVWTRKIDPPIISSQELKDITVSAQRFVNGIKEGTPFKSFMKRKLRTKYKKITLIHSAARAGLIDGLKFLLEEGKYGDVNSVTEDGSTALILAVKEKFVNENPIDSFECIKLLIERGSAINHQDNNGTTALHWACIMGDEGVVKYLVENNAGINIKDKDGRTPLFYAKFGGRKSISKYLIEKNAIFSDADEQVAKILKKINETQFVDALKESGILKETESEIR